MKHFKWIMLVMLLGAPVGNLALANGYHHSHFYPRVGVGVYFGPGFGWPGYYPGYYPSYYNPPYGAYNYAPYYDAPVVAASAGPTMYVEQGNQNSPQAAAPLDSGYWYYCDQTQGYYPYVKECPGGWRKVAPQPPRN